MRFGLTISLMFLLLVVGSACSSAPKSVNGHRHFDPATDVRAMADIRAEASRDAANAIASGNPYVCEAGGFVIYVCGLKDGDYELIKGLPRRRLPSGCVEPRGPAGVAYAEVFNAEIVRHFTKR